MTATATDLVITDLADTIAEIFDHYQWTWGLELAGIPEHVPDTEEIARKINELLAIEAAVRLSRDEPHVRLRDHGRIILCFDNPPPYHRDVRVLLDIGEIPIA